MIKINIPILTLLEEETRVNETLIQTELFPSLWIPFTPLSVHYANEGNVCEGISPTGSSSTILEKIGTPKGESYS